MSRTLFISGNALHRREPVAVLRDGADGSVTGISLSRNRVPAHDDCVVVLDGSLVLSLDIPLPAKSESEARRAAPFAIEEYVAEPLKEIHVALGPLRAGGNRDVRVVSHAVMESVIDGMDKLGLSRFGMLAEHDLSIAPNVLIETENDVIAILPNARFRVGKDLPDDVLGRMLKTAGLPDDCRVFGRRIADRLGFAALEVAPASDVDLLSLQARLIEKTISGGVDLRQGRYAATRKLDLSGTSNWRRVAALVLVLGVIGIATNELEKAALAAEIERLGSASRQSIANRYGLPLSEATVATVRSDLSQSQRGADEFEILVASLYGAVGPNTESKLTTLRYDRDQGLLNAGLMLADYSNAEQVANDLREAGLQVEVGDLRQSGTGVSGEIRIRVPQ